jgi:hypothetical protein
MPAQHGAQTTAIHAHATAEEKLNRDIDRYLRRLERSVSEYLNGSHEPLVLAGTEYVLPIYRTHNRYRALVDEDVATNPSSLDDDALREGVWQRIEPGFRERRRQAVEQFNSFHGHGRTGEGVEELASAAIQGRVQTVFVRTDEPVWGSVSADGTGVEVHGEKQPGDVDLVDVVAVKSFMQDADVHLDPEEELTTTLPVAAILRY